MDRKLDVDMTMSTFAGLIFISIIFKCLQANVKLAPSVMRRVLEAKWKEFQIMNPLNNSFIKKVDSSTG